jgi:hypothetical protein
MGFLSRIQPKLCLLSGFPPFCPHHLLGRVDTKKEQKECMGHRGLFQSRTLEETERTKSQPYRFVLLLFSSGFSNKRKHTNMYKHMQTYTNMVDLDGPRLTHVDFQKHPFPTLPHSLPPRYTTHTQHITDYLRPQKTSTVLRFGRPPGTPSRHELKPPQRETRRNVLSTKAKFAPMRSIARVRSSSSFLQDVIKDLVGSRPSRREQYNTISFCTFIQKYLHTYIHTQMGVNTRHSYLSTHTGVESLLMTLPHRVWFQRSLCS